MVKSYEEVLKQIELSPDTPETITCRMCGEPMHLIKINNIIGYWVHHGEALKKCIKKNDLHPGKPVVAQNMKFYKQVVDTWQEVIEDRQKDADSKN